jgi:uncharacterized OB-fold protein
MAEYVGTDDGVAIFKCSNCGKYLDTDDEMCELCSAEALAEELMLESALEKRRGL